MEEKAILAIGGAVIKTAKAELIRFIENGSVEMLIHNGGSLFHDFQIVTDPETEKLGEQTSFALETIVEDYGKYTRVTSGDVWSWIKRERYAPEGSITALCEKMEIPVLLFTGLGTDFWQLAEEDWAPLAWFAKACFDALCRRMEKRFYYLLMGSAVIHPEVFVKAIATAKPKDFRSDVVDFLDMYRPRTRVAKYGEYFLMTHKQFLESRVTRENV